MTESCPVCYCELENDKNYVITSCLHKFCFFCIARVLTQNSNATCPMCRELLYQSTENIRLREVDNQRSRVNVEINFNEIGNGLITPEVEINIDSISNPRDAAAELIQRSITSRLRDIHQDLQDL